ncbi:MAG: glutaredoxin 3 [Acidobacteriota bacterium]|jgi:glutaredoxin 3
MSVPVTVYTMTRCPYCKTAKNLLDSLDVQYEEINLDVQPDRWKECEERSGRQTVPQIFWGDKHIGGCDDLLAIKKSGELQKLVDEYRQAEAAS